MRSGAAAGHRGAFHQAAFYDSDEQFLAVVGPFLAEGLAAGEPTICAFAPANQALVRKAFGTSTGLIYLDGDEQYSRPAGAIRRYRQMMADFTAGGASQIRSTGDVPHPGVGVPWEWWARYESVVNHAFDDFPWWGLCPYDIRTTPAHVLGHVRRTHPRLAGAGGDEANSHFQEPREFAAGLSIDWQDRLESTEPELDLVDIAPAAARDAVTRVSGATSLCSADVSGLVLATTEAITNAMVHGEPPVRVRIWIAPQRMLVAVTDRGAGPANPFAGLTPAGDAYVGRGGLGLWLAHQMCSYVSFGRGPEGFTIRLFAGAPHAR